MVLLFGAGAAALLARKRLARKGPDLAAEGIGPVKPIPVIHTGNA